MKYSGAILYVPDVRASLAFYERAFGLKTRFLTEGGEYGDLLTGGAILGFASVTQSRANFEGGVAATAPERAPPAFEVAFEAEDVQAAFDRAVKAGAAPLAHPAKKPWGQTVSFLRDADGHVVEISSPWAP